MGTVFDVCDICIKISQFPMFDSYCHIIKISLFLSSSLIIMLPIFNLARRQENLRLVRLRRNIRNTSEPFQLSDKRFIELFRLNKAGGLRLINLLEPHLHHPTRNHGISIQTMVLTALRFYATGCYQRSVGQDFNFGLSQTSVHRCVKAVTRAIDEHLSPLYIRFPSTMEQRQQLKANFMNRWGFPGCIGAIDCTHVAILKPTVEEHNFINRKGYHSLNVQAVCGDDLTILNLNANFGGSTHDAFVWRNSLLQQHLQELYANGDRNSWLIGDSGYPLQPYLLTPYNNPPPDTPEAAYNAALASARNTIERCFGLLKMRFRCVLKERMARYSPHFVASLITVCATLHNFCILEGIPLLGDANDPLPDEEIDNNVGGNDNMNGINLLNEGRQTRTFVVNRYFRQN